MSRIADHDVKSCNRERSLKTLIQELKSVAIVRSIILTLQPVSSVVFMVTSFLAFPRGMGRLTGYPIFGFRALVLTPRFNMESETVPIA